MEKGRKASTVPKTNAYSFGQDLVVEQSEENRRGENKRECQIF
jgi:hypothetical protein